MKKFMIVEYGETIEHALTLHGKSFYSSKKAAYEDAKRGEDSFYIIEVPNLNKGNSELFCKSCGRVNKDTK